LLKIAIVAAIFILTLAVIIIRPYRVPESIAAATGAGLMLLGGFVGPQEAWNVIRGEWNLYGFFLGLMTISALADQAGIFEMLAIKAGRWAGGRALRLYLAIFALGALITAFLSNDASALILTPIVYALVTRLRLPVMPFMFACTFIANTASFVVPVSNPINILILDTFGEGLSTFLQYLLLPSLLGILFNIRVFVLLFRHDLNLSYNPDELPQAENVDPRLLRYTGLVLLILGASYVIASSLEIPLAFVALSGALLLLSGSLVSGQLNLTRLRKEISWSLFIFITGMFLIVRGVENVGLSATFGNFLLQFSKSSQLSGILAVAGGTALGSNLINNLPMALIIVSTLNHTQTLPVLHQMLVFAAILGADLGPNLTIVGSLAAMLWILLLRRKGLEVSTVEYFKLGMILVPIMIIGGSILIWLRL
jgi:arsenical pump membrane protein